MTSSLVGSEMCIRDRFQVDASVISCCNSFVALLMFDDITDQENPLFLSLIHIWTLPTICSV
eukprot:6233862-Prorocentrum_lima.AAC.1